MPPSLPLPVSEVDVCVIGAGLAGVAAAASAAEAGASVLLLCLPPYLGDDVSATFRHDPSDQATESLGRTLFGAGRPTPMQVKRGCEAHLAAAGVRFLYGYAAVNLLRDANHAVRGVIVAGRSGRLRVHCRQLIDATWRADVARLAGIGFQPYPAGEHDFMRVVIGGDACRDAIIQSVDTDPEPVLNDKDQAFAVHRYQLRLHMADASPEAFAQAEQTAARATFHPEQQRCSERLWQVPPDPVFAGSQHVQQWQAGCDSAFARVDDGLWIAGPCADCSRAAAAALSRPASACRFGADLGMAVAVAVKATPPPGQ
ncbi:MAG: FAD-dependent oxidoreductase, partial [Planctomycetota bacterium]